MYNEIASAQNSHKIYLSKKAKSKMRRLQEACTANQQKKLIEVVKWKVNVKGYQGCQVESESKTTVSSKSKVKDETYTKCVENQNEQL